MFKASIEGSFAVQLDEEVGYFNRVLGRQKKRRTDIRCLAPAVVRGRCILCRTSLLFLVFYLFYFYPFFYVMLNFLWPFLRLWGLWWFLWYISSVVVTLCFSTPDFPPPHTHRPPDFLISLTRLLPRHVAADDHLFAFSVFSKNPGGPGASPHLATSPIHPAFAVPARDLTFPGVGKLPDAATTAATSRPSEALPKSASKSSKKEKEKDKDREKDKDAAARDDVAPPAAAGARRDSKVVHPTPERRGTDAFAERVFGKEDAVMGSVGGVVGVGVGGGGSAIPHQGELSYKGALVTTDAPEKPSSKRKKDTAAATAVVDHADEMQGIEVETPRKEPEKKESEKKRKRQDDPHPPHPVPEEKLTKQPASHGKARPSTSDGLTAQQTPNKRGARKRADSHAALVPATPTTRAMKIEEPEEEAVPVAEDEDADADAEDDGEGEEDEPVYCYCEQVSYGEMVACDAENCPREWYHLDCVGLNQAPKGKGMFHSPPPSPSRYGVSGRLIRRRSDSKMVL